MQWLKNADSKQTSFVFICCQGQLISPYSHPESPILAAVIRILFCANGPAAFLR